MASTGPAGPSRFVRFLGCSNIDLDTINWKPYVPGGGGGGETLAQVLTNGNLTGGLEIEGDPYALNLGPTPVCGFRYSAPAPLDIGANSFFVAVQSGQGLGGGGTFQVDAGEAVGSGQGGDVTFNAGQTVTGNGGNVYVSSGNAFTGVAGPTGQGGVIFIQSGSANGNTATANGGDITIQGGSSGEDAGASGANIDITAGSSGNGTAGTVTISGGDTSAGIQAGGVIIRGGGVVNAETGDGGDVEIASGNGGGVSGDGGSISIFAGSAENSGNGGGITLISGSATGAGGPQVAGAIRLSAGSGDPTNNHQGGDIVLEAGDGPVPGDINLVAGNNILVGVGIGGNIQMTPGGTEPELIGSVGIRAVAPNAGMHFVCQQTTPPQVIGGTGAVEAFSSDMAGSVTDIGHGDVCNVELVSRYALPYFVCLTPTLIMSATPVTSPPYVVVVDEMHFDIHNTDGVNTLDCNYMVIGSQFV
jgi:hypothetical protein